MDGERFRQSKESIPWVRQQVDGLTLTKPCKRSHLSAACLVTSIEHGIGRLNQDGVGSCFDDNQIQAAIHGPLGWPDYRFLPVTAMTPIASRLTAVHLLTDSPRVAQKCRLSGRDPRSPRSSSENGQVPDVGSDRILQHGDGMRRQFKVRVVGPPRDHLGNYAGGMGHVIVGIG
jgi:hypothetical protein